MHARMIPVDSSNLAGYIYLGSKYFVVAFQNGTYYRYDDVPKAVVDEFAAASSKGKYLNQEIKGSFDFQQLGDEELDLLLARFPEKKFRSKTATNRRGYSPSEVALLQKSFPILAIMF